MPCVTVGKLPPLSALAAVVPEGDALDCADDVACAEDDGAADEDAGAEDAAADDFAEVEVAPSPSGCWIVDNWGRLLLPCASTAGATASTRPRRPIEGRIVIVCATLGGCRGVAVEYQGIRLRGQRGGTASLLRACLRG